MAPVVLGPVPATWPLDGEECSGTETSIAGVGTVTVTTSTTLGTHVRPLVFEMTPTPAGSGDGSAASGSIAVTLSLGVVGAEPVNTPASIVLPVRPAAGDVPVGEGRLSLVVIPCAGGERLFGLLRTRGLDAGCYPDVAKGKGERAGQGGSGKGRP